MTQFHFVTPLLHPEAARGRWTHADGGEQSVQASLERCLLSVANQTAECVIDIVGHALPPLREAVRNALGARMVFHAVDHPAPSRLDIPWCDRLADKHHQVLPPLGERRRVDKYGKIRVGISATFLDPGSTHLMILDHDDMVHRQLVEESLASAQDITGGRTVKEGYIWRVGDDFVSTMNGFHKLCGSCNIVCVHPSDREQWLRDRTFSTFDRGKWWLYGGHHQIWQRLRALGRPTLKIPFRAVIYATNTGSNVSGIRRAGKTGRRPLHDVARDFGIEMHSRHLKHQQGAHCGSQSVSRTGLQY